MKIKTHCIAVLFSVLLITSAIAGGGEASFKNQGLHLLKQAPALTVILTSEFSIKDRGVMGPADAPFKGGRLYTYMDFRGTAVENEKEGFLLRVHFRRGSGGLTFNRLEILPVPPSINIDMATFKELHDATGANKHSLATRN